MKLEFLMALSIGLFFFISASPAQPLAPGVEQPRPTLKFNAVKCFNEARARLKTQKGAAEYLKSYLNEKDLQTQVSGELQKIMADVEKALKANPNDCALVSVTVDSSTNGAAAQYNVRSLRFEGIGDAAVQSLAPNVCSSSKFGPIASNPAAGFNYDTNLSHLICFGIDQGEIKATPVFMPALRTTLIAAVGETQKANGSLQVPPRPTNVRIRVLPQ